MSCWICKSISDSFILSKCLEGFFFRDLGYWEDWGTSPTDKLVPYPLRGFAITTAIREGVPAITLAQSLGTYVRMLEQTYYNFLPEAEFDTVVRMSGSEITNAVKYNEAGFPI